MAADMANAHDFRFETLQGKPYPLKKLAGRPFMVVNTASKCAFTSQYQGLEALWTEYREAGLVIVGVPSNDFGQQEPGSADDIASFCKINHGVDFPMMAKTRVTGADAHPFFKWAGAQGGFMSKPKWNFFKYLVTKDGGLADWFSSLTAPESPLIKNAIARILDASA